MNPLCFQLMALVVGLLLHFLLFLVALHCSLNLGYRRRGQCTGKVNAKISRWNRNKKQPNHNWGRQEQQRQQWMWPMKIYTNCVFLILFHKASATALLYDQTLTEYSQYFFINDIVRDVYFNTFCGICYTCIDNFTNISLQNAAHLDFG